MEHLLLLEITIGSKDIVVGSEQLGKNIIVHSNQASTYIDRQGNGDQ